MEERGKICKINRNIISDMKAHDIYTLHSSEVYPTLPSVSYGGPFSDPLLERGPMGDPLRKSNARYRTIMKKLSLQHVRPFRNLPAVVEEDHTYLPVVPTACISRVTNLAHANSIYEKYDELLKDNEQGTVGNEIFNEDDEDVYETDEDENDDENDDTNEDDDDSSLEILDDSESWVDLSKHTQPASSLSKAFSSTPAMPLEPTSPDRVTPPPFGNGEEYLRLLREAQKESNQSSARVSLASSRRDTPRDSPKSPPNSPNTEVVLETEELPLTGVYINYYNRDGDFVRVEKNVETDWIWDWSSRPDQTPPKEWRFVHPGKATRRGASIRRLMVGNSSLFSRDVLYTLLITNVLSLLLGTGIGIWLSRRSGGGGGTVSMTTMPIN